MIKTLFPKLKEVPEYFALLVGCAGICLIVLMNIDKLNLIYIVGDEFGYWANAAKFAGLDWSEVAANNPYYSYGWSILLTPIVMLTHNPAHMYKLAIGLNAILLCGTFVLAYLCAKKLFGGSTKKLTLVFCAFAVTLYSANIFQSQTTQCEVFLYFWFWLLIFAFIQWIEKTSIVRSVLLGLATAYIFVIHMRSIPVCMAVLICAILILLFKGKANIKYVLMMCGVAAGVFLIAYLIKGYLSQNLYINKELAAVNDISGQTDKISLLFSITGVKLFVKNIVGRLFYLGSSTFLLFYWGLYVCIKRCVLFIKGCIKHQKPELKEFVYLLILLSAIGIIAVSAISMLQINRVDTLIYGRYSEIVVGPVVLLGLTALIDEKNRLHLHCLFLVLYLLTCGVVFYVLEKLGGLALYPGNVPGIYGLARYNDSDTSINYMFFEFVTAVKVTVIATLLVLTAQYLKKIKVIVIAVITACVWLYLGFAVADNQIYNYQKTTSDFLIQKAVQSVETYDDIYYISDGNVNYWTSLYLDYIQFLLPEVSIKQMTSDEAEHISEEAFIIVEASNENIALIEEDYICVEESNHFRLYVNENSQLYKVLE